MLCLASKYEEVHVFAEIRMPHAMPGLHHSDQLTQYPQEMR
jgi:hypothetical protein